MKNDYLYQVNEDDRENYRLGESNITDKLTYLLIGGGIGAIVALLLAPKAGRELRGDLADVTRKGYDKTRTTAQQLREHSGEYYQQLKQNAGNLYNRSASGSNPALRSNDNLVDKGSTNLDRLEDDSYTTVQSDDRLTGHEIGNRSV
jgi:gas vesicle protein